MSSRYVRAIIALVVVAALFFAGGFLIGKATPVKKVVAAATGIPLSAKVNVTQLPSFNAKVSAIKGWTIPSDKMPLESSAVKSKSGSYVVISSAKGFKGYSSDPSAKYCTATGQTTYLPSYGKGENDEYLTYDALYNTALNNNKTLSQVTEKDMKTSTGQKVQFATGYYSAQQTVITTAKKTVKVTYYQYVAIRAFPAKLFPNGNLSGSSTSGPYGSNPRLGIPTLQLTYTCVNEKGNAATFDALLKAYTVTVK